MNLVEEAILFATKAHEGQTRKSSNIPYILHPFEVSCIIATITDDYEVIAAGILHDTIEDCGVTKEQIEEKFGSNVAELVSSESEEVDFPISRKDSWVYRKEQSLEELKNTTDIRVKILWLADKLANMRSFYRLYLKDKENMWEPFHQKDPEVQLWYYQTIADNLTELADTLAYKEYKQKLCEIFGEYM